MPLNQTITDAAVLLAGSLLLTAFFGAVYRQKRQEYLFAWTAGWLLFALYFLATLFAASEGTPRLFAVGQWFLALAATSLWISARLYSRKTAQTKGAIILAGVATVWAGASLAGIGNLPPLSLGVAVLFVVAAREFWREGKKQESRTEVFLGSTFVVWALLLLAETLQPRVWWLAHVDLLSWVPLLELFSGVLMITAVYEEERRRVERNMLALSNLNLATSGFAGGEIQKMLAQALDRVLNVVRIPAGALLLQYGDASGPSSIVATGLSDAFCPGMQENRLDEYLVNLVARLGGLVVLPDLSKDSQWEVLEKDPPFLNIRAQLKAQNLRTVVGISLQAKERVFGVLLLATPDSRSFTPAELRLLLALGHQIGMAVENSYLVQQTTRRTEELHVLNEVGRMLSSTLNLDDLFDRLFTEMRRMLEGKNFYIALLDPAKNELTFELESVDGQRLPKYSTPVGDGLTEHVMNTRQPLLIRDGFDDELKQLGIQSQRSAQSFCGVPLVVYDRTIGVLGVSSHQVRALDEGHLELLRVLASEAGIAIENARLFSEEQKKSRHLSLLNNITGHAIATLNPDEMLSKIAEEMEKGLTYDHIGIAILDYSAKELVISAEAGTRREALGRRVSLGEGPVGEVGRSGQVVIVRDAATSSLKPILPESTSAIALPVAYADQLLGALYVESVEKSDFPEEEILLLRTISDVFAGAWHNALTFQKAQEQAITDGLTGVKTHRFLMEALSAEWKRSTRASRPFSLVLMDLDRFKFVNDFYGHLEGDVVLRRVAHILEQNCRRSDVVARYGGDEFVILMPETSVEQATQLASKLRSWVASDPLLRDKNITASFGIAGFPVHGSTPQELIQVADSSMYLSKHQGGNSVSSAEQHDPNEAKKWKHDVLEAYLGVTLKRLFTTGPEAFDEIYRRVEQFARSLGEAGEVSSLELLPAAVVETVSSLAIAIDAKDQYTNGHSQKVSKYAVVAAEAAGFTAAEIEEIRLGALLHDVGKVGIPEPILHKAGPLDATEWETMKGHTLLGDKLLEPLVAMKRIREMVRHHHEFFDGSGYPDRLDGHNIPRGARLVAIADAYDTITSERTYKKPRTHEDAFEELARCASTQFDPELVEVFIEALRRQPLPLITVDVTPIPVDGDTMSAENALR